jgi:hypothetical protein
MSHTQYTHHIHTNIHIAVIIFFIIICVKSHCFNFCIICFSSEVVVANKVKMFCSCLEADIKVVQ